MKLTGHTYAYNNMTNLWSATNWKRKLLKSAETWLGKFVKSQKVTCVILWLILPIWMKLIGDTDACNNLTSFWLLCATNHRKWKWLKSAETWLGKIREIATSDLNYFQQIFTHLKTTVRHVQGPGPDVRRWPGQCVSWLETDPDFPLLGRVQVVKDGSE